MLRQALMGIGVAVVSVVVVGPGWVVLHSVETSRGDVPAIERVSIADPEANAWTHLARAGEALVWDSLVVQGIADHLQGEGAVWHEEFVAAAIESNAAALDHAVRAIEAPQFQFPGSDVSDLGRVDEVPSWIGLASLFGLRSMSLSRDGETHEAIDDALRVIRLGQRLQHAHGAALVHALPALRVQSEGLRYLRDRVLQSPLDRAETQRVMLALETLRPSAAAWRRIWTNEHAGFEAGLLAHLDGASAEDLDRFTTELTGSSRRGLARFLPRSYSLHVGRTSARLRELKTALIESAAQLCVHQPALPVQASAAEGNPFLRRNGVGEIVVSQSASSFERMRDQRCKIESEFAATHAFVAIEAWARIHGGELPDSLETLVPTLLPSLPTDGFRGRPLRYDREARLLHLDADDIAADLRVELLL